MYNNKLAVALKSAGKVLREFNKDEVYVPFGNEYSIFIKNMNSVRALVKVSVDGVDVGDGTKFVVDPNGDIDIERFIKNGNFDEGNRLKFIERTGTIEDHRGVGIEDGLVRVEFNFERPAQTVYWPYIPPRDRRWNDNVFYNSGPLRSNTLDLIGGSGTGRGIVQQTFTTSANVGGEVSCNAAGSLGDAVNVNYAATELLNESPADEVDEVGITVPGSISDQQFKVASWFPTETETHVIVLKILGETKDNVKVRKAVTVKTKCKCTTCNCNNKATAKFCTECGTSLNIV